MLLVRRGDVQWNPADQLPLAERRSLMGLAPGSALLLVLAVSRRARKVPISTNTRRRENSRRLRTAES